MDNNYIVASYFTKNIDSQRGIYQQKDDANYIINWYESLIKLSLNGIIFYDDLSEDFIKRFPLVEFIRTDVPEKIQLYDARWLCYNKFFKNRSIDNIFFTDIADVKIIKNPFIQPEYNDYTLFCGDEENDMSCYMISNVGSRIKMLKGYRELMNSGKQLLNCGIVGGNRKIMYKFCQLMGKITWFVINRRIDTTVDMPVFNYVVYKNFINILHGFPVNGVFTKYEQRDDIWFIHK